LNRSATGVQPIDKSFLHSLSISITKTDFTND
jgi:hypothetical protein